MHLAHANHEYDALDQRKISPPKRTHAEFLQLAAAGHSAGMKLLLDGVFNPMGPNAPAGGDASCAPRASGG
jgi:glycosidase